MAAARGEMRSDFLHFQRAGTDECVNGGIVMHCVWKINTFVYFYIIFYWIECGGIHRVILHLRVAVTFDLCEATRVKG